MSQPSRAGGCKAIVATKWMLILLHDLLPGPRRFTELKRDLDGISQRMLTATLRSLERDGLLTRTVHNAMPPHVSYALTPMGREMLAAAEPLMAWSTGNLPEIQAARADYDHRAGTEQNP
ncbi:winged helix-turn-helix transcriptional regulator [Actinoplanes derwentensis]|uniref:winged helix-turn-helix transcriptional regulator n=1 Tax=Actinoplanes derwentensis TaxID=113562 RepID=UPI001E2FB4B7|nr:helix-turn-helix domain-containing protein [Actinoplanes derwentensis]